MTSRSPSECERLEQLLLEAARRQLQAEESAFCEAHLSQCGTCADELAVLQALRLDETEGAALALSDLGRQRLISSVLERANQPTRAGGSARRWRSLALAAAGCVLVGLVAGLWLRGASREQPRPVANEQPRQAPAQATGLHGVLLFDQRPQPSLGSDGFAEGQRWEVGDGRVALELPLGTRVLVEAGSSIAVKRLRPDEVVLELRQGELLASVVPRPSGPRFVVEVPWGRVVVKGTVFAVRQMASQGQVTVLRGEVSLERTESASRFLAADATAEVGSGGIVSKPLESASRERALTGLHFLERFASSERGARLEVRSQPSRAQVLLDGEALGTSPLSAWLPAGRHQVELRLGELVVGGEKMVMAPGDRIARQYLVPPPARPSQAAGTQTVAREPEASLVRGSARRSPEAAQASPPEEQDEASPAARLLADAQRARAARAWADAARAYRQLIKQHPARDEAASAEVALGTLLLGPLADPAGALAMFDRYLERGLAGSLSPEAMLGRADALRALGRRQEERSTLREFLRRFPEALQANQIKRRLATLESAL